MLYNVTATAVAAGTAGAQGVAATPNMRLMGFCVRESAGTPALATLNIRHGTTNTDAVLAPIVVLASTSLPAWFGPQGIPCANGIYVDRTAGNTTLTLYTAIDN